jgi:hypothetical protein
MIKGGATYHKSLVEYPEYMQKYHEWIEDISKGWGIAEEVKLLKGLIEGVK